MSAELDLATADSDDGWRDAMNGRARSSSVQVARDTSRLPRGLHCWFAFCAVHRLHPFAAVQRTHIELYLHRLEQADPPGTLAA